MKQKTVKENSKITFRDLWTVFWRWWLVCEMSNSYERMQSISYCFSLIPVLKKLYPNREDFIEAMQRHLIFFNSEGICANVILGMSVAMEEEKAENPGSVSSESIIALKSALMGPVAGIGDTVTWGTVKPLVFTIALTASANGSVLGWLLMFLFVPITVAYGWFLMIMGYRLGKDALSNLMESGWINRIISGASILGLFMVGTLAASYVDLQLTGTYMSAGVETTYQSVLDGIIPGMIPLSVILGIYYYTKRRGQRFGMMILTILASCLLLAVLGLVG